MPAPRGDKWETDIEQRIAVVEQLLRKPLTGSGASIPEPGVFQIDGNLWVTGELDVSGSAEISGGLSITGDTTISGDLDVTGDFSLPAQSIDDSWLANLVKWGAVSADSATGWSTSTSMANKAATSITVPSDVDTALVVAWGLVTFQDSSANRFDCRCVIEGNNGPTLINLANTVGQTTVLHSRSLSVTPGQVLNLSVQVLSAVATGGAAANTAICGGFALFSR